MTGISRENLAAAPAAPIRRPGRRQPFGMILS